MDPSSGSRYYPHGQANRAEAIRILRRVDMPLDDIAALLAQNETDLVAKRLGRQRELLAERVAEQERILRFLERLIERKEGVMPYDVTITKVEAQTIAALRTHTTLGTIGDTLADGFARLVHQVGVAGGTMTGAPFVVYHTIIDEQTDGEIEICIPATDVADDGAVRRTVMPAHTAASTVHRGPYDEVGPAYHTLSGWIQEHGHEIAGPPREIYLNDPREVPPDEVLTEVQWPIEPDDA